MGYPGEEFKREWKRYSLEEAPARPLFLKFTLDKVLNVRVVNRDESADFPHVLIEFGFSEILPFLSIGE